VTPYDITGGSYPGYCIWTLDVTDYHFLLRDEVVLSNYISTWIGDDRGWIVTIKFLFISGTPDLEAYRIQNLWTHDYLVYGDPDNPIDSYLQPVSVDIDPGVVAVKVRAITTGHGQGNTGNAAEFAYRWHKVFVDGITYSHYLWRSDCATNPCSPQGGTWQYNRAGWCPGDRVVPWDNDVTLSVTPGTTVEFDYDIQAYENFCRPTNPDCIDGVTCTDCDYNYTGHTEPNFSLNTQLIFYRLPLSEAPESDSESPARMRLNQNYPNPFNPLTSFEYVMAAPGRVTISIFNAEGKLIQRAERRHVAGGTFRYAWDGTDDTGVAMPSGVYLYMVETAAGRSVRKMCLLK